MPGWFPCGSDSWLLVVGVLQSTGEPWPYELILDDLAWFEDRWNFCGTKRPGRPTLQRRWGCSERTARKAMDDPSWCNRQRMSSRSPANVQRASSPDKGKRQLSPENVQPMSSQCPANVLARVVDTQHPAPNTTSLPNPPPQGEGTRERMVHLLLSNLYAHDEAWDLDNPDTVTALARACSDRGLSGRKRWVRAAAEEALLRYEGAAK